MNYHRATSVLGTAAPASAEEEVLLCEQGHWFLKHRKSGETPHKRFVFTRGDVIYWSTKEFGAQGELRGKLQQLDGANLMVVPGAATNCFEGKKRMNAERRNRVFSVVGPSRSLDLEAESEAERHLWVRALSVFVKRCTEAFTPSSQTDLLGLTMSERTPNWSGPAGLGVRMGAAMGVEKSEQEKLTEALDLAEQTASHLRHVDPTELRGVVRFPRMQGTIKVRTGDMVGRWQSWELELADGVIKSVGKGSLPLRHVLGLGLVEDEKSAAEMHRLKMLAAANGSGAGAAGELEMEAELRLRLRLGESDGMPKLPINALTRASYLFAERSERDRKIAASLEAGKEDKDELATDLLLRAPASVAKLWHSALSRSMALVEDLELSRDQEFASPPPPPAQLQPLKKNALEEELNSLFEDVMEGCAGYAREAVDHLEPLMQTCVARLTTMASTLPPRADLFAAFADGAHKRFGIVYQVLLVRYDLHRQFLDTDGQAPPSEAPREILEPRLMLELIGWARRYEVRMADVGAGQSRALLNQEQQEGLISAYLHACRQLTKQWAKNIVFCEQQTMLSKDEDVGMGHGKGERTLTQGIITMRGEDGGELWLTELHIDLFRIVHEHVELGINTGMEVVLFNVMLASADFLVDVQNELLAKCRSIWRSLGFLYLCALINNCRRCAELWETCLTNVSDSERSPLSEALASSLHLSYVSDGFVNLGFAAMQLAARRVLVQLELPLSALFAVSGRPHQLNEMAAIVDHFLSMVADGVAGTHATRTCAICLEQLLCTYLVLLLAQEAPFGAATPHVVAQDLRVFERLLHAHCPTGPFASRAKAGARVRASALLHLLASFGGLLARLLAPSLIDAGAFVVNSSGSGDGLSDMGRASSRLSSAGGGGGGGLGGVLGGGGGGGNNGFANSSFQRAAQHRPPPPEASSPALVAKVATVEKTELLSYTTQLLIQQPACSKEVLARLLSKCGKSVAMVRGKKAAEIADACDKAKRRASTGSVGSGSASPPAGGGSDGADNEAAGACAHCFSVVDEVLQIPKKQFAVGLVIERLGTTTRRWG